MEIFNDWRNVDLGHAAPYVFPEDMPVILGSGVPFSVFTNKEEFINSELNKKDVNHLHLGLLPNPYGGNISNARICILTLNPGFNSSEYEFERTNPDFREAIIRAIHQRNGDDEYPFCALNPDFREHPGYVYWAYKRVMTTQRAGNKFRNLARLIARTGYEEIGNTDKAFRFLARKTCVLEYMCYHSRSFNGMQDLALRLPSTQRLVEGFHTEILPQALGGEKLVICMRGPHLWRLENINHPNVIIYPPRLRQSASLSVGSPGGHSIINFLGI